MLFKHDIHNIYIYIYIYIYISIYTHICKYECMSVYMHACGCMCVCTKLLNALVLTSNRFSLLCCVCNARLVGS